MKTTITKIKLTLALCLFLLLPLGLFAAPLAYVCGTGEVTLQYAGQYNLLAGDRVFWQEFDGANAPIGNPIEKVSGGVAGDADLKLTGGTTLTGAGEHFYKVYVLTASPGGCTGDVSDAVSIYMLPSFTVTLTPDLSTYCVSGSTNADKATVAASTTYETNAPNLPNGVTVVYSWTGSDGGAPDVTNTKYVMSTIALGAYTVTAKATFSVSNGIPIKSSTGAGCEDTQTTTITVTPTPDKPSITIAP